MNPALLIVAPLLGFISPGLQVDTDSPDALCPEIGVTRRAVADRLGTVEVEGSAGWRARYTVVHAPGGKRGDVVRLILLDPSGKTQLDRDLPMSGETCETMAQAIALVLERFFRELGEATRTEEGPAAAALPPAAEPASAPAKKNNLEEPTSKLVSPASAGRARPRGNTDTAAVRPEQWLAFEWALGLEWEALPAGLAGSFELGLALDRWRVRLRTGLPPTHRSERVDPGEAELEEWHARISFERLFLGGPWSLSAGPELFAGIDTATTVGLEHQRLRHGATLGCGAALQLRYWLAPRFGVGLGLAADAVVFSGPEYTVSGHRVLEVPPWRGSGALQFVGASGP